MHHNLKLALPDLSLPLATGPSCNQYALSFVHQGPLTFSTSPDPSGCISTSEPESVTSSRSWAFPFPWSPANQYALSFVHQGPLTFSTSPDPSDRIATSELVSGPPTLAASPSSTVSWYGRNSSIASSELGGGGGGHRNSREDMGPWFDKELI